MVVRVAVSILHFEQTIAKMKQTVDFFFVFVAILFKQNTKKIGKSESKREKLKASIVSVAIAAAAEAAMRSHIQNCTDENEENEKTN